MRTTPLLCLGLALTMSTALGAPAASAASATEPDAKRAERAATEAGAHSSSTAAPQALDRFARRSAASALATAGQPTTRLVVRTRPGADLERLARRARGTGGAVKLRGTRTSSLAVDVPDSKTDAFTAALEASADVLDVQPARRYAYGWTPSDPRYSTQQSATFTALHAERAWDMGRGDGVRVAVVDSGVDDTHPELAGAVVARYNAVDGSATVTDQAGHGTAVASVIAAETTEATDTGGPVGTGMAGAASGADVLAVKVEDAQGDIWSDAVAEGIRWAVANDADVINLSLGGADPDPLTRDAVAAARAAGVVVVAAAGNTPTTVQEYPAAYPGVVSVGATTADGTSRTSFSTYGSWVSLGAPGEDVLAAVPVATDTSDGTADGYEVVAGTSFSSPLVAAEAALVLGRNPRLSGTDVERALLSAHDGRALGFGRGLVDYAKASAAAPVPTAPELTAPTSGATVGGALTVAAASTAAKVRFSLLGTAVTADAAVVDGQATAVLPTWGLAGPAQVSAAPCSSVLCGPDAASVPVVVANPSPLLTSPLAGAAVDTSFVATATAGGGGVRFLVDGVTRGIRTAAPYTVAVSTNGLADGAHTVTAVQCNAAANVCDFAHPSAARTLTVKRLRPALSVGPNPFSPNGDGRRDTATLTYRLEQPQTVDLRITTAAGVPVRTGRLGTDLAAGTYRWVWNGRNNAGALLGNGTYRVELSTSRTVAGGTVRGLAAYNLVLDRTGPVLGAASANPRTVYPVVDNYGDSTRLGVTSNEALSVLEARIYNRAGTLVRIARVGAQPAGARFVTWNGRSAAGTVLPAGAYTFAVVAYDVAGNATMTARTAVNVSAQRLVARTGVRTLTPAASFAQAFIGDCSDVFRPGQPTWVDSFGYYSDFYCDSTVAGDDLAAATHRLTLPAAVRYGTVRISAYGAAATDVPESAAVVYLRPDGTSLGQGFVLSPAAGTYTGPTVAASSMLQGRTLTWLAGTTDYNWYDVKHFTVAYTYSVLV